MSGLVNPPATEAVAFHSVKISADRFIDHSMDRILSILNIQAHIKTNEVAIVETHIWRKQHGIAHRRIHINKLYDTFPVLEARLFLRQHDSEIGFVGYRQAAINNWC